MAASSSSHPISIGELVALNDELAALARAGIPFEQGLLDVSRDLRGRAGQIAAVVAHRLQAGERLTDILSDPDLGLPPVWIAMVRAGARAGRLQLVLESLAATGRRLAEARRVATAALIYPSMTLLIAYLVFVFLIMVLTPVVATTYVQLIRQSDPFVEGLASIHRHAWWLLLPPFLFAAVGIAEGLGFGRGGRGILTRMLFRFWPALDRAQRDSRIAALIEVLAMLLQQDTPVGESLRLAGASTGEHRLQDAANRLADRYDSGGLPTADEVRHVGFPPLLGFMLARGGQRPDLGAALLATAEYYRERAGAALVQSSRLIPVVLSAVVGGTVTVAVCLAVIYPVYRLIWKLGSDF